MSESPDIGRFAVPFDIEGARLRVLDVGDVHALAVAVEQARVSLEEWVPHHRALDDPADHLRIKRRQLEIGRAIEWGIWDADQLLGCISLHDLRFQHDSAELGYWLVPDATGRGLATKAAARLVEHAFHTMSMHRLTLKCILENEASRGVPSRLGMIEEAVHREEWRVNGRYRDRVVYRMLVDEWRDARSQVRMSELRP